MCILLLFTRWYIISKNTVNLVNIGVLKSPPVLGLMVERKRVIGLFVLTPANITDETGVIINNPSLE